jgi:hypothetical protein
MVIIFFVNAAELAETDEIEVISKIDKFDKIDEILHISLDLNAQRTPNKLDMDRFRENRSNF